MYDVVIIPLLIFIYLFSYFRAAPAADERSQARGPIGVVATSLHHSHSNSGSEPSLWSTPQLTATPGPYLTHWARPGIELRPHGCQPGSLTAEPRRELPMPYS